MQNDNHIELKVLPDDHHTHSRNNKISYTLILVSSVCWVSGFVYANEAGLKPWETNLMKGYPLALVCYFICRYNGYPLMFKSKKDFQLIMLRNVVFLVHGLVTAAMQYKLPLPILHNINSSMSILVMIIEVLRQGKHLTSSQKKSTVLTMLGIIFIGNYRYLEHLIRPDYQFSSEFANYSSSTSFSIVAWSFFLFVVVVVVSFSVYISSFITFNAYQVNFHYSLMIIIVDTIIYMLVSQHSEKKSIYLTLPLSGLIFTLDELSFTAAILYSKNIGVTMLLSSFTIVVSYFWSIFRYGEEISVVCVVGSGFIVYGIYRILVAE